MGKMVLLNSLYGGGAMVWIVFGNVEALSGAWFEMKKWYCSPSVVIVNAWFLDASFRLMLAEMLSRMMLHM
jgi:hypothetical protein